LSDEWGRIIQQKLPIAGVMQSLAGILLQTTAEKTLRARRNSIQHRLLLEHGCQRLRRGRDTPHPFRPRQLAKQFRMDRVYLLALVS